MHNNIEVNLTEPSRKCSTKREIIKESKKSLSKMHLNSIYIKEKKAQELRKGRKSNNDKRWIRTKPQNKRFRELLRGSLEI